MPGTQHLLRARTREQGCAVVHQNDRKRAGRPRPNPTNPSRSMEAKTSFMMDLWHLDQVRRGLHPPGQHRRPREVATAALLALAEDLSALDGMCVVRLAAIDLSPSQRSWAVPPHFATASGTTGLTNFGPVLLEMVFDRPAVTSWYTNAVSGERGWSILGRERSIAWPPRVLLAAADLTERRLSHTTPIGWGETDGEKARKDAARATRIAVVSDDPQLEAGLGDALGEVGLPSRGLHL